jgi:hypothetical protein
MDIEEPFSYENNRPVGKKMDNLSNDVRLFDQNHKTKQESRSNNNNRI